MSSGPSTSVSLEFWDTKCAEMLNYQQIQRKIEKSLILFEIWIFGCVKVLNSQRFQKKVSASLEFWAISERIAWVLGYHKRQSVANSSKSAVSEAVRGRFPYLNQPDPAPDPAWPEKSEKTIILSEIWIFGFAEVLNCQKFQKKVSVSLEFWAINERIAWVLGHQVCRSAKLSANPPNLGERPQILPNEKPLIWNSSADARENGVTARRTNPDNRACFPDDARSARQQTPSYKLRRETKNERILMKMKGF